MVKKDKKQLIRVCIILAIVAVVLCIVLNQKPKENTADTGNNQSEYIDTSDIEETTINWEDIVNIDISGFEGNAYVNISYNDIPEFQEKLEAQWAKWEEIRPTLDPVEDKEEIDAYSNWLEELNKVYSANFCEVPADLNNHVNGDTIKITCDNETLRKLNYKFNDGFEYTLSNIATPTLDSKEEKDNSEDTVNENSQEEEVKEETISQEVIQTSSEVQEENTYSELGNDVFIGVYDIESVKLNPSIKEGQRVFVTVFNDEDFNTVKEYALSHTNTAYIIEYDGYWYGVNGNYEEREECKGFTLGD